MDDRRKNYRAWDAQECGQERVSPREVLPEDDLTFFLLDLMPQIDLSAFHQYYAHELRGQPPFDVTMMVTLLVYAYCVGVRSSRKIAAACERNLAFRAIVGNRPPDFRTISDFRKIHLAAFESLFVEVLRVAGELGMVKLGNLSTDGTKMGANASRHKAMSYAYMGKEITRLQAEIKELLEQAEQMDASEDAALGSRRGDELPEELKRRSQRLAKIEQAKARLEAEAAAQAAEEQRRRDTDQAQREAEGRKRRGKKPAPVDPTPEAKAQTNFTDPDAKIMRQSNKGFDYSFNSQAVVDDEAQIIVAARVTTQANDKQQAIPMAQAALENLAAAGIEKPKDANGEPTPIPNTADSGYFSEKAVEGLEQMGLDPHLATGRQKHHETALPTETTEPSAEASVKEKMQRKLRSAAGKALYAARKHIIEPVFGQIKGARGIRKFLLRGLEKISAEWNLICLTHNLLKIWRRQVGLGIG
ncbi:MAG TPA: transposase [Candidatus Dormibacteraeota bacterium]|nr:transposase [Candidatus Dormibacteraeota bacterium]